MAEDEITPEFGSEVQVRFPSFGSVAYLQNREPVKIPKCETCGLYKQMILSATHTAFICMMGCDDEEAKND